MLPQKWVRGLSSVDLLGKFWGRNTYRYIDQEIEDKIEKLFVLKDDQFEDSIDVEIKDIEGTKILRKHLLKERVSKLVIAFKNSLKTYD
jgi:hypothetical protein